MHFLKQGFYKRLYILRKQLYEQAKARQCDFANMMQNRHSLMISIR